MIRRGDIMKAAQIASEVYHDSGAKDRVEHQGFVRVDPFTVAGSEGLLVMLRPLESLLGAFLRLDTPGIMVNSDRPPGLVHMTCAHELGHYFLGHETTTDATLDYGSNANPIEQEADWFAFQLLMPRSLLATVMKRKGWTKASLQDPQVVYQLSLRLGLSFSAAVWSLQRQKLLTFGEAKVMARLQPKTIKLALVGAESAENPSDVWLLDQADRDLVLEPRASDRFIVDLPSHVTSGYLWTLGEAQGEGFRLRPMTLSPERASTANNTDARFGVAQTQRYFLETDENGTSIQHAHRVALDFVETQPWRGATDTDDRFVTSTQVESIQQGLSPQSKAQIVDEVSST